MKQLIFFLSCSISTVFAQDSLVISRLNLTDFLTQVKENHPIAVVTQNNVEMSQRVIQLANERLIRKCFLQSTKSTTTEKRITAPCHLV